MQQAIKCHLNEKRLRPNFKLKCKCVANDESSNYVEKVVIVFTAANVSESNKKRTFNACSIISPKLMQQKFSVMFVILTNF